MTPMLKALDPDRPPDLSVHAADGLQHAELAAAIGDRYRQRIDDAQNRDQHGDGDVLDARGRNRTDQ